MQDKIKMCKICGRSFTAHSPNTKYCCYSCADAGRLIRRRKWQASNPNYSTIYMREYRTAQRKTAEKQDNTATVI